MLRSKRVVMDRSRRVLLLGGTLTFLPPSRLPAQPDLGREHRPVIASPTLAEDPSAVPLQVSVNHPISSRTSSRTNTCGLKASSDLTRRSTVDFSVPWVSANGNGIGRRCGRQ